MRPPAGIEAKICGLRDRAGLLAARGANLVGFVFFPRSPRAVTPAQAAEISAGIVGGPLRVGLFVDPSDAELEQALRAMPALDVIQLHGEEPPERSAAVRARFGRAVMKAVGVAEPADLDRARAHAGACDRLLLDARPPPGSTRPGGNAARFDWSLLRGLSLPVPWLLAGGLTPGNVAEAIATTGAPGVDVSSGVESAPGVKDAGRVRAFLDAARGDAAA